MEGDTKSIVNSIFEHSNGSSNGNDDSSIEKSSITYSVINILHFGKSKMMVRV
jgi:hypothetical protein